MTLKIVVFQDRYNTPFSYSGKLLSVKVAATLFYNLF